MILADKYYQTHLTEILNSGCKDEKPRPSYADGTPAHSQFITQVFEKYDLQKGEFPITTLRNTATKTGIREVLWIYQHQDSSLETAKKLGIHWWDNWDIGDGTIGQRYGATIKKYNLMDKLLDGLENNPFSRRHIIDMYQYSDLEATDGLHPCAYKITCSVRKESGDYYLDLTLDQRSNDYLTAGFINKIQYVALQMMIAGHLGYKVGKFAHLVQNLHIYDRHLEAAQEILNRDPLEQQPALELLEGKNFYDYTIDDFKVKNIQGIKKIDSPLELAI